MKLENIINIIRSIDIDYLGNIWVKYELSWCMFFLQPLLDLRVSNVTIQTVSIRIHQIYLCYLRIFRNIHINIIF